MRDSLKVNSFLRPINDGDLEMILAWRNHPNVRQNMLNRDIISIDNHRKWFSSASKNPAKKLYIFQRGALMLGFVQFEIINDGGVSRWGFYLSPDAPRGLGKDLGRAALDFAFADLNLHKVYGEVLGFNVASMRLHQGLGFKQEGVLMEQYCFAGEYSDVYCFGLLARNWEIKND